MGFNWGNKNLFEGLKIINFNLHAEFLELVLVSKQKKKFLGFLKRTYTLNTLRNCIHVQIEKHLKSKPSFELWT
jgi:hypothetical protein